MEKEIRQSKVTVCRPGGNASTNARQYRVSLPTKWVKEMEITPEERNVEISFDGTVITIRKTKKTE